MPRCPTPHTVALRTALTAVAAARPRFGMVFAALILGLFDCLVRRGEAAWILFPDDSDGHEVAQDPYAGIHFIPAVGRAPHAACIEAGLVPDWILPGVRNRGMRPAAAAPCQRRRARPVRAPPVPFPLPG